MTAPAVPAIVAKAHHNSKLPDVWMALLDMMGGNGTVVTTMAALSEVAGCSRAATHRALRRLRAAGVVVTEKTLAGLTISLTPGPLTGRPRLPVRRVGHSGSWRDDAACVDYPDLDFLSSEPAMIRAVQAVCGECPVRAECLDWALERRERFGVWGGVTPAQRQRMRTRARAETTPAYFVASVGRVSEATIRKYIDEQTTRPTKGKP